MKLFNWLNGRIDLSDSEQAKTIVGEIRERLSTKALAWYVASSYVSETIARCPIKRYVKGKPVKDKMYYLWNVSANVNESASVFKIRMINKLLYEGEVLVFEHNGNLYIADGFNVEKLPIEGDVFVDISVNDDTRTFIRRREDVVYLNIDDGKLKALVSGMLDDYAEILNYAFEVYKSSNSEKYKLVLPNVEAGDQKFMQTYNSFIKEQLSSFINSQKAVYPQFKGQSLEKFVEPNGTTDSKDVRELRKEIFEITAQAFKMPVSMLYGNTTNTNDVITEFITFRIDPLAKLISEELTRATGTIEDYLEETYMDVDTTSIMHINIFEKAPNIYNLLGSGLYNIDMILEKLGEQPLNTEFSKQHWMTKNNSRVEDVLNGEVEQKGGG